MIDGSGMEKLSKKQLWEALSIEKKFCDNCMHYKEDLWHLCKSKRSAACESDNYVYWEWNGKTK